MPTQTEETDRKLLIIDDDYDFANSLAELLELKDYRVAVSHTAEEARRILQTDPTPVALIDMRLKERAGPDLISGFKAIQPDLICVMVTTYTGTDSAIDNLHNGAYDYLSKPLDRDDLLAVLDRCFERLRLEREQARV